jgi:hypothetical protein
MKSLRRQQGKGASDLIEEATHLLRTAPAATLAAYYVGTTPFTLGLLYFWADMSRSPFANRHLAETSLLVGVLFIWMKFWQAVFACRVRAHIAAQPPVLLNFRSAMNLLLAQTILQPWGLFLIPLSMAPAVPFAWVYAWFQNVTALADGDHSGVSRLCKKSWRQAMLWPRQNHLVLVIMLAFAFCVFLNWATVCLILPGLLKMLLGVESTFSKSPYAMLNTTFFAGMFSLTYLCVDPILKTVYSLRCFYGESLQTGEDLKSELRSFAVAPQRLAALLLIFVSILFVSPAKAEQSTAQASPPASRIISPADLEHAIAQTIRERKYSWRMPRENMVESSSEESVVAKFFNKIGTMLRTWVREFLDWLDKWLRKLFHHQPDVSPENSTSGYGWIMAVEVLLYALVAGAVAALVIFLYRVWRGRRKSPATVAEAIFPLPDLADENIRADQLPEDGWTKLARELLERGEFRLAMRAFYLASLAHLAGRNLISIARFKSNRDYEQELRRRAHSFQNLPAIFGDNLLAFERIWYGMHEVTRESVGQFAANVEKIRADG